MNPIPQFLQNFRMYTNGNVLTGVEGDVTLPNFENTAETISGAGILGEFDSPVPGSFKSITIEVGFRILDQNLFNLAAQTGTASLTFRGSQQIYDIVSGGVVNQAVRVESRGPVKGLDGGKASVGKPFDSKFKQEILFIAMYLDDVEVLYLDKLNFIYRVNSIDQLAGILQNM
jgi:hypothetical protein